jgi:3-oxoacyl-[acyl-carrier protein] reductase
MLQSEKLLNFIQNMNKKYLFITGGNGQIGKAIISKFQDHIVYAPSSKEMDCSDINSIKNYISKVGVSKIDVFIHCAGINNPKPYIDSTEFSILNTMKINALSFLYITQELSKHFVNNSSKILAISSIYGSISRVGRLEYNASKSALNGMIKSLALELGPKGIIVNSISPGFIETSLTFKNNSKQTIDDIISRIPLARLGQPEEIAWYVNLLCSPNNRYLTGQNIIIDGGYLVGAGQK